MSLKDITSLLNELRIPTALVFTPINLESEKKKFFNSEKYNPLFQYRIVKNSNKKIFEKLSAVSYTHLDVYKRQAQEISYSSSDRGVCKGVRFSKTFVFCNSIM